MSLALIDFAVYLTVTVIRSTMQRSRASALIQEYIEL